MTRKAFVLLSGGLDSTTCLFKAIYDYAPEEERDQVALGIKTRLAESSGYGINWVEAVSIDYGQRHLKETEYARKTCQRLGIKYTTLDLSGLLVDKNTMLGNKDIEIPDISYADIKGVSPTYVPFRNGTMLSVLAAHAQKWVNGEQKKYDENAEIVLLRGDGCDLGDKPSAGIYFGAHSEDAHNWAYPDCTPEFIGAMANAIYVGTYHAIRLITPLQWLMKKDIVLLGASLGVPFENTWSCYAGENLHCGVCPTCRSRRDAFIQAGITDPTEYAKEA